MGKLVAIEVKPGNRNEIQSGIFNHKPKIYGNLADEGCSRDLAFVVIHPTNNFHGHYLIDPIQKRGRTILALNTRYVGNDAHLIVERTIQDLGAGIKFLRKQGYKRICLIGNSGGGALSALYQAQAEKLTITHTPDGRPIDLTPDDLPPVDSVALVAAASGRGITFTMRMDAAVINELDIVGTDPALDIFNAANGPPFSADFVEKVRAAQIARNRRISDWCVARLRAFEANPDQYPNDNQAFVVYRTNADPCHVDLTLDPNDRAPGKPKEGNYAGNGLGRFTTVRSWLSQWSYDHAVGRGADMLAKTTCPVLMVYYTADNVVLPSFYREWEQGAGKRGERVDFKGVGHYPQGQPEVVEQVADLLVQWADRH